MLDYALAAGFDWDGANSDKSLKKHGIDRLAIESVFAGGQVQVRYDHEHSSAEERYFAVGHDSAARPLVIVFTLRQKSGRKLIRVISARRMTPKEEARYVEEDP